MLFKRNHNSAKESKQRHEGAYEGQEAFFPPRGADIAPFTDGDGGEYLPRHMADVGIRNPERGDYLKRPDGSHVAANGAVIREPMSDQPEILPDHEFTEEKEDLNLLIM